MIVVGECRGEGVAVRHESLQIGRVPARHLIGEEVDDVPTRRADSTCRLDALNHSMNRRGSPAGLPDNAARYNPVGQPSVRRTSATTSPPDSPRPSRDRRGPFVRSCMSCGTGSPSR